MASVKGLCESVLCGMEDDVLDYIIQVLEDFEEDSTDSLIPTLTTFMVSSTFSENEEEANTVTIDLLFKYNQLRPYFAVIERKEKLEAPIILLPPVVEESKNYGELAKKYAALVEAEEEGDAKKGKLLLFNKYIFLFLQN